MDTFHNTHKWVFLSKSYFNLQYSLISHHFLASAFFSFPSELIIVDFPLIVTHSQEKYFLHEEKDNKAIPNNKNKGFLI